MPSIYLKETGSYFAKFVTVTEQEYGQCKLFKYFKHQLKKPSKGPIWISNQSYPKGRIFLGFWDFWERYLTIKLDDEYKEAKLTEARVYHNQYDSDKTPLVLVLLFENTNGRRVDNKYYTRSKFNTKFTPGSLPVSISELTEYKDEKCILKELLTENDKLSELLTYNIGKKQGDKGNGNGKYNGGKIIVQEDLEGQPTLSGNGFTRYKHTPVSGNGHGNKNACVIYNNNLLCRKDKTPIKIQNRKYDYINVYFSDDVSDPLLLELNTNNSKPNTNAYYYHKRNDDGSLYWKKIEKKDTVLGINLSGENDVYTQLFSVYSTLYSLLNNLKSHLKKTILFMINNKDIYELTNIQSDFKDWKTYRIINKSIKPEDKTKSESKCLGKYGFKVYEHDFTETVKDIVDGKEKVQLRFIIPKSHNKTYNEITLVNAYFVEEPEIKEILYTVCKKELYVYFYGSDPRPLLLCYNGQAYKPESMDEYYKKWCSAREIKSCECSEAGFTDQTLLKTLYQISMFLNPVNLSETINAYDQVKKFIEGRIKDAKAKGEPTAKLGADLPEYNYTVQTFGDTDIKMKVQAKDLQCYRRYTFESAMVDSGGVVKRNYRLGSIFYGEGDKRGADQTCLTYPNHLPLQSVSLYYYMYDQQHRYPLLIQLDYGFGGPLDDYFRVCHIGAVSVGQAPGPSGNGGAGGSSNGNTRTTPSTQDIAKNITWVKMKCPVTDEGKQHEHSSPDPPTPSGSGTTSNGNCKDNCPSPTRPDGSKIEGDALTELKEKDAEFVKRAHEIQQEMRDKTLIRVNPLVDYLYRDLEAELQWHIERHCYDVRKKFDIKYEKGEKNANLILATDENCHEDSIIGYVLGGGAVGVAGGGGWKFAVVALSMFIKV